MNAWTAGYIVEIDYTHGYYSEISPSMLSLALLNRAVETRVGWPLRYLELGFGQGLSLNIHAAACPGEFWGTDFNPAHTANARELAQAAGSDVQAFDLSFTDLAARDDLPDFDIIAMHGVWSWISEDNRSALVEIVRRRLAVGGALYLSYNCTPGWSPSMPLRHLMTLHSELSGSGDKGIMGRIDGALSFAQQVADSGAHYFRNNPAAADLLKRIAPQDRKYLAHEYFSRDWEPMPFSAVAGRLGEAKVSFAASATLHDHVDALNFNSESQQLMGGIGHPILYESVRDYMVAQQFRRDVFVKGARPMSARERSERFRSLGFALMSHPEDIPMKLQGPVGEVSLQEAVYSPLIDALAADSFALKTVSELAEYPSCRELEAAQLMEALIVLTGAGHARPAQSAEAVQLAQPRCAALNAHLCGRARFSGDAVHLASPVIGGGVPVSRFQQLFLLARLSGRQEPEGWAQFAWENLDAQGERIVKAGKAIDSAEDNLAELLLQARAFSRKRLPVLRVLGIA